MQMSDSLHVPVVDLGLGHRRFVWDLPYSRIFIDVFADGRVAVNGESIVQASGSSPISADGQPVHGQGDPLVPATGRR